MVDLAKLPVIEAQPPELTEDCMRDAFSAYAMHLPNLYSRYNESLDAHTTQQMYEMGKTFNAIVKQNLGRIITDTYAAIRKYVNYYDVDMKTVDEFKLLYFMGKTLSDLMKENKKPEISRIIMYGAVIHLEQCYSINTGRVNGRTKLIHRLKTAIERGDVDNHLGEYGIYLIFKCGSNMLVDYIQETMTTKIEIENPEMA